jgi:hypothetical protein
MRIGIRMLPFVQKPITKIIDKKIKQVVDDVINDERIKQVADVSVSESKLLADALDHVIRLTSAVNDLSTLVVNMSKTVRAQHDALVEHQEAITELYASNNALVRIVKGSGSSTTDLRIPSTREKSYKPN